MFLQKYVQEVDEQLARLIAIRDQIASLAGPSPEYKVDFNYQASLPSAAEAEVHEAAPVRLEAAEAVKAEAEEIAAPPAKRRGRPKGSRNKTTMIRTRRTAAPEPRALATTVPIGPVVVSPAQLAKRSEPAVVVPSVAATPAPAPAESGGGLDALIRELTERRATAFSPAA